MKITRIFLLSALILGGTVSAFSQQAQYPIGTADYYSDTLHGKSTASGELYDKNLMTAAHLNLPFGTMVRATDHRTGRTVDVKVNDRTSDWNKVIVLSRAAATHLGVVGGKRDQISIQKLANGSQGTPVLAQSGLTTPYSTGGSKIAAPPIPNNHQFTPGAATQKPKPVSQLAGHHQISNDLFPSGCPRCLSDQLAAEQLITANHKKEHVSNPQKFTQAYSTKTTAGTSSGGTGFYEPGMATKNANNGGNGFNAPVPAPAPAPIVKYTPAPAPAPVVKQTPAPAPVPAPAPAVVASSYRVQFGAFRNQANARRLADQITQRGVHSEVAAKDRYGNYRVITCGAFPAQSEAKAWANDFSRTGITTETPIVVR